MLDILVGRPNFKWRRRETYAIILFSLWVIASSSRRTKKSSWIVSVNNALQGFTPLQLIATTLTVLYALQHLDKLFGLAEPEHVPTDLYAREYNRATWIVTGLDAGFATAMNIQPKWLRDICSVLFSVYYFIRGDEADNKVNKFREVCTLDMLRITWDKMENPYIRLFTMPFRPRLKIRRKMLIPRPPDSKHHRPIIAWLFFDGTEEELARSTELILDVPGGGFVAMGPTHHEERLRMWAKRVRRPVLSVDYGKAPEFPYPFAIDECFDAYKQVIRSKGRIAGMSGTKLDVVIAGDSAGGNIAANVMLRILEYNAALPKGGVLLPKPVGLALAYAALNFSFTNWAWPSAPTPAPSSDDIAGAALLLGQPAPKPGSVEHVEMQRQIQAVATELQAHHVSRSQIRSRSQRKSRADVPPIPEPHIGPLNKEAGVKNTLAVSVVEELGDEALDVHETMHAPIVHQRAHASLFERHLEDARSKSRDRNGANGHELHRADSVEFDRFESVGKQVYELQSTLHEESPEPRLTMSSKNGYLHDRIISPTMMWAMCLLYLGPGFKPGVEHDYHLSPILAPERFLALFPPLLMQCGGRDPLVDDTILFGGRVREAKRKANQGTLGRHTETPASPSSTYYPSSSPSANGNGGGEKASGVDAWVEEARAGVIGARGVGHGGMGAGEACTGDACAFTEDSRGAVTMQIFPGWSHGYLQMAPIMKEARVAIDDVADWIVGAFVRAREGNIVSDY